MGHGNNQFMWTIILMLAIMWVGDGNAVLCPSVCYCEEEALSTSCASASLEFVPIQLNPDLRSIDLSNNKISNLHFTLAFYEKLVKLDLASNKIRTLGSSNFESQRDLKHLNLSSNGIEKLSKDSLKGLRALTVLDLSNNALEELTSVAFRELYSLTTIRLSGNRLVYLQEGLFKSTKQLQDLYLDNNQFLEMPMEALSDATSLHHLSLSANLIESIDDGQMPSLLDLRTLLLDKNVISDIHLGAMSGLPTLDHLDLSDNNFTVMPTAPLSKLSNLTTLRLSGNFITTLTPVAFRGLFHLKYLKLNHMRCLERIDSRAFVDNINLEKVWMDFNMAITRLPTMLFHGNPKVRFVSVRYNKLETLEATHFPLDQLSGLNLGGNPLQCNCSLVWLWHLVKHKPSNRSSGSGDLRDPALASDLLLDVNDIQCEGPEELQHKLFVEVTNSQINCSVGWVAAVSVIVTVVLILAVVGGVIYWVPANAKRPVRSAGKKDLDVAVASAGTLPAGPPRELYDNSGRTDKYVMARPHPQDYHSLHSWDPYGALSTSTMNIYEQLNDNTKTKPHIVYV